MSGLSKFTSAEIVADPLFSSRALKVAAECAGVSFAELIGPSRERRLVHARWAVMVALRKRGLSLPRIARRTGRCCHSTVKYALKTAPIWAEHDPELAYIIERVEAA